MAEANGIDTVAKVEVVEKDKEEVEVKSESEQEVKPENAENAENAEKAEKVEDTKPQEPPNSQLEKQIIRQIEYYFGDINLPRDKFLKDQMKLDDGWIPLDVMLKFKRLSNLTTDIDVIVAALQKSTENLMEVNAETKSIRRAPERPLPVLNEERRKELMSHTVYVKGFPIEGPTLDLLLDYFNQYGPIDNVNMRSYHDKTKDTYVFKGSVFVMFSSKEKAEAFLKLETVKYEEHELMRKWQSDYIEEKRKQREETKQSKRLDKVKARHDTEDEQGFPKGSVLHLKGFNAETTREQIKAKLVQLGAEVAFINFNKGDSESFVRLQGEDTTKGVMEKVKDTKLEIGGAEIEIRALEGDEESEFLEKAKEDMLKRRLQGYRNKRGSRRGGGGRGGYQGNRKRKGGPTWDDPPSKQGAIA